MVSIIGRPIRPIKPRLDILVVILLLLVSFFFNFASFLTFESVKPGPVHPNFECQEDPSFIPDVLKFASKSKYLMCLDGISMTVVFLIMVILLVSAKNVEVRIVWFPKYKKFILFRVILLTLKFATSWILLGHPFPLCTYWFQMPCEYLPWTYEVIGLGMRGNFLFLADVVITGVTYFGMKRLMDREAADTVSRHFESLRLQSITTCSTLPHPNFMNPRHSPCQHEIYDEVNEDYNGYTLTRKKMEKIGQTVSYKKGSETVTFHNYEKEDDIVCLAD